MGDTGFTGRYFSMCEHNDSLHALLDNIPERVMFQYICRSRSVLDSWNVLVPEVLGRFLLICFSRGGGDEHVHQSKILCMAHVILVREEEGYMATVDGDEHDEQLCVFYCIEITII